jgi:hypothetical protein
MDHSEAIEKMASEKYLLDELASEEREAFEEHLFECHECALDVRAGSVLIERSKLELANPTPIFVQQPAWQHSGGLAGWFAWLRPAVAIPVMALLLITVAYQNLVTYPALKNTVAENNAPRLLPAATLVGSARRGEAGPATIVRPGQPFLLPLDISSKTAFHSYRIEFHNPSGAIEWSVPASADATRDTLTISAPGVKQAGRYEVVVIGLNENGESSEVGRYPIELQFAGAASR